MERWLSKIVWLLVPHALTRIVALPPSAVLIPMGAKLFAVAFTFVSFYAIAAPLTAVAALTDLVTHSVVIKMTFCLGATTIAQLAMALAGMGYLGRADWKVAGQTIADRAQTDRQLNLNSDATGGAVGGDSS